ncbi:MAG: T9SS type A sorting domain-containing protein [Bacteroidetes bacterium]|nr:T9SS type A sorting domain-containing protein [Bacteroidota bacterium]
MKKKLQTKENENNGTNNLTSQLAKLLCILIVFINCSLYAQSGTLDLTFVSGTSAVSGNVATIVVQNDGKVIIGGTFTSYNGTNINRIARINTDGSLDGTFNVGSGFNGTITKLLLQSDGKIIAVGNFTTYKGSTKNRIVRLNSDGSVDATFNVGTGTASQIYAAALQSDGMVIIAGTFTSYNGTSISRIARLNTNGSIDTNFNPGTGPSDWTYGIAVQPDGKIIIVGNFLSYNGTTVNRVARLNSDGSLENNLTFNAGTAVSAAATYVYGLALQSDGKIIIGGSFTTFNGVTKNRLVRLNTNGSIDNTFNAGGSNANLIVYSCNVLADDKILIGGTFTTFNASSPARITCLNADGTKDVTFNTGGAGAAGASSSVLDIALNSNKDIFIGGTFLTYNGATINKLAKLNRACSNASVTSLSSTSYTNCGIQSTTISVVGTLNDATNWQWYNAGCGSGSIGSGTSIVVSPSITTTYYVRGEGGCTNPQSCSTTTITVNAIPNVSISAPSNTVCLGSLILLTGSGASTYTWNPGNTSGSSAPVGPTVTTTYSVIGTAANGCSNTAFQTITPVNCVTLTKLTTNFCNTTLTTMDANTLLRCDAVSNATNYEWQFSDPSSGAIVLTKQRGAQWTDFYLTSYFPNIQFNKTYNVKVRANVGGIWGNYGSACTLTTPTALGGLTELTPTFCNTSLTTLNATTRPRCNSVTGATNYEWQFSSPTTGTILFTRQRNAPYTDFYLTSYWPGIAFSTTYNVKVRAYTNGVWGPFGNICTLTTPATASGRFSLTQSEMDDLDMKNNININAYPNPVYGALNIDFDNIPANTSVEVYNMIGELVLKQSLTELNNIINTTQLSNGLYHAKIIGNNKLLSAQKIVKQ